MQTPCEEVCYRSVAPKFNLALKNSHISNLEEITRHKIWNSSIRNLPDYPRYKAVAAFHIATMHDCLNAHLHKLRIVSSLACPLCTAGQEMNSDHLRLCPALKEESIYSRYWEARELLFRLAS
ncbi:hypothetical protein JTE90_000862 [Oedothorax gibbosus]|uniref:Reverse transcriptase zinc-binding domain-containing protein n=1 Tax=Oedothorax gibbosus TaxID=931172 RepID=A0AAV6VSU7_9ARAC|nr:hypothetical protein JTE90_000862 [Oedothorax gibbosus]